MVSNSYPFYLLKDLVFSDLDAMLADSNSIANRAVQIFLNVQFSYIIQVCVMVVLLTGVIILMFYFQGNAQFLGNDVT